VHVSQLGHCDSQAQTPIPQRWAMTCEHGVEVLREQCNGLALALDRAKQVRRIASQGRVDGDEHRPRRNSVGGHLHRASGVDNRAQRAGPSFAAVTEIDRHASTVFTAWTLPPSDSASLVTLGRWLPTVGATART
jgi:hypothetical protein